MENEIGKGRKPTQSASMLRIPLWASAKAVVEHASELPT